MRINVGLGSLFIQGPGERKTNLVSLYKDLEKENPNLVCCYKDLEKGNPNLVCCYKDLEERNPNLVCIYKDLEKRIGKPLQNQHG